MKERKVKKTINAKPGVLLLNVSNLRLCGGLFTINISTKESGVTPKAVSNEREVSKEDNKRKTGGATPKPLKLTPMWGTVHN
jgi:hypothetical protein